MQSCTHLTTENDDYFVWFTGRGKEYFCVCQSCADLYPQPPETIIDSFSDTIDLCQWESRAAGVRGEPEVHWRNSSLQFEHRDYSSPLPSGELLVEIVPHHYEKGLWYCLTAAGRLYRVSFNDRVCEKVGESFDLGFSVDIETGIQVSPHGDYAAIYEESGSLGVVIDIYTGRITARLNRGEYRPENSRFPLAFFNSKEKTLLVAAADWNRLEVIDPFDGKICTSRTPAPLSKDNVDPSCYLDYFHGQLTVSPNSRWIADYGWAWCPVGSVRTWSLVRWNEEYSWESEVGPSVREVAARLYYWDGPLCWVGDSTLAVWGWGGDDEWLIPAIELFDVESGRRLDWFAGPKVRPATCISPKKVSSSLFFDSYLFSVSDTSGIAVWDVSSGECLLMDPRIAPINYHSGSREFITPVDDGFRLSRLTDVSL